MSFFSSPVEILEYCLRDKKYNPLESILKESIQCVKETVVILTNLIDTILSRTQFSRFHKFVSKIKSEICNTILQNIQFTTIHNIKQYVEVEKNYIWTDDEEFLKPFEETLQKK